MNIETRTIDYADGVHRFQGRLCVDSAARGPVPGVLVAHTWRGRSEYEDDKARQLAELGYAGFALDLFGKGVLGTSPEQNRALMQPFMDDRALLQRRMLLALRKLRAQDDVDETRVAAIGFCFGGLCVLDLARSGANLNGVASFHGLLSPPPGDGGPISAKVLILHGWKDPMAPPEQLVALGHELSGKQADWQIHAYGNAMHAFTNPAADNPDMGTLYQAEADRRSWTSMRAFLAEVLS